MFSAVLEFSFHSPLFLFFRNLKILTQKQNATNIKNKNQVFFFSFSLWNLFFPQLPWRNPPFPSTTNEYQIKSSHHYIVSQIIGFCLIRQVFLIKKSCINSRSNWVSRGKRGEIEVVCVQYSQLSGKNVLSGHFTWLEWNSAG